METQAISHSKFILGIEQALKTELSNLQEQLPKALVEEPLHTGGDEADMSTQLFAQHLSASMKERNLKRMNEITFALNRVKLPNFGICEECENDIEQKRLIHVPTARFCVQCQSLFERKKQTGDDDLE